MELNQLLTGSKVFDLSQPLWEQTPFSPNAPGFKRTLLRRHGDIILERGVSFASDLVVTGTHVGTHMDALSHISCGMELYGGHDAATAQLGGAFSVHGIQDFQSFVGRGVLLDVPGLRGTDVLEPGEAVTAEDLEACAARANVEVAEGDIVLVRTGWSEHFSNPLRFVGHDEGVPGIDLSAAQWLSDRRVRAVGGETIALERIPPGRGHADMPVHAHLIVEHGITIIEVMRLDALASAEISECIVVLAPLPLVGATGSPVRPLAIEFG